VGGSFNTTTTVMTHDDDVADFEEPHTEPEGGDGTNVFMEVLVRDVAFGENGARERRENESLRDSGVTVWVIGCGK